jgi:tetratricopeptide (TPR) repeat protein
MPNEPIKTEFPYDFFVSRRGTAANIAIEVAEVLEGAGHRVLVQDFDIPFSANFVAAMHDAVKSARHFVGLLTEDYDVSPFTREEWTAFFAISRSAGGKRRLAILRVEDVAPPGLFASIVYGDLVNVTNREKRQEIILAAAEGRSIGKRRGNQIFHGVPPRNPDFTGRADLLISLHKMLNIVGKPAAITQAAIHGLGGVGKSSLAAEYAHLHVDDYAGVWWTAAENRTVLITSLAELAGVFDSRFANESNTERAAKAALATLANQERPWLLVYDNVSDPDGIRELRPTKGARLLITTRHPDWGGQASELEINVLERSEAIDFLLKRTDRTDTDGAAGLAEALGCLPLALDHAGAYVTSAAISFQEYAVRYQELIAKAPRGSLSTAATFDLAIEKAKEDCEDAEKLLGFFSVLAPERIPLDLVDNSIISERERDDAMSALFSVSPIRKDTPLNNELAISVHRLVRTAMRTRLSSAKQLARTLTTATGRLLTTFPHEVLDDVTVWPRCEQLLPHLLVLARDPDNRSKLTVRLLEIAALFLDVRGTYYQSEQICREAMSLAEKLFGKKHPGYASTLVTTAKPYLSLGKFSEAENMCREAMAISTRKRAQEDEFFTDVLDVLGLSLNGAGRPNEAEPYQQRAVTILRKQFGLKSPKIVPPLANLAASVFDLGRFSDAEQYLREAISISQKAHGRGSYVVAQGLNNLARVLLQLGRYAEAEALAHEAIAAQEKLVGRQHPTFANALTTLALILRDTNRTIEAEPLFREATTLLAESLGLEHPDLGFVQAALSKLLTLVGNKAAAREQANQALKIHSKGLAMGLLWHRIHTIELSEALEMAGLAREAGDIRSRYRLEARAKQT